MHAAQQPEWVRAVEELTAAVRTVRTPMRCYSQLRLEILTHLICGERCVKELARMLRLDEALTSKHLTVLRSAGFVDMHQVKKTHVYRLSEQVLLLVVIDTTRVGPRVLELRLPADGGLSTSVTLPIAPIELLRPGIISEQNWPTLTITAARPSLKAS